MPHFRIAFMSTTPAIDPSAKSKIAFWTPWATIAFVAVLAGLLLPQLMMSSEMVIDGKQTKADAKNQSKTGYTPPAVPDAPNPQAMLVRLVTGTVIVLGLAVGSLFGVRRWMQTRGFAGSGPGAMRLIETLQLGNRCSLHLVHLGKREVLIGVDGGGIKTIVPLTAPFEDVLADSEATAPETIPFTAKTG
jgi:flagellar biogenesis protein FliO